MIQNNTVSPEFKGRRENSKPHKPLLPTAGLPLPEETANHKNLFLMAYIPSIFEVSQIEHQCAYVHRDMLGKGGIYGIRNFGGQRKA